MFWSSYHHVNQIIHLLLQKSKYLNFIWVISFFHFIFLLKWSKKDIKEHTRLLVSVRYLFFSLTATCQTRIYLFIFLSVQEIRHPAQVSDKMESMTCLIILDVSLGFFPAFRNIEAAFERCSTNELFSKMMWWNIAPPYQWAKTGKSHM